jgi:hypothetical protein
MSVDDHHDLVQATGYTLECICELEARGLRTSDWINISVLVNRLDVLHDTYARDMQGILAHLPAFPVLTQMCEMLQAVLATIEGLRQQHGDRMIPTVSLRRMCAELKIQATQANQWLTRPDNKQTICQFREGAVP